MTFLAHWKFDEYNFLPSTCYDSQGGGSGYHHGTYGWTSSSYIYYGIKPVGIYKNRHCQQYRDSTIRGGRVISIQNLNDLRIYGEMSIMCWLLPILGGNHSTIALISGSGDTSDVNTLWYFLWNNANYFGLYWEPSGGTWHGGRTAYDTLQLYKWQHIAARRKFLGGGPNFVLDLFLNGSLNISNDNGGAGFLPPTDGVNSYANLNAALNYEYNPSQHGISSLRLYDEALTDNDIESIYNSELALFKDDSSLLQNSTINNGMTHGVYGNIVSSGAILLDTKENAGFHR